MLCSNHPEALAADRCAGCAEPFCADCLVEIRDQKYCGSCKVLALQGPPAAVFGSERCEEANRALLYAILGLFCFGIILGPVAISKAGKAKAQIAADPRLTGTGMANVAIAIGVVDIVAWAIGLVARFSP